jgi:HD-GYP domain-containing protein (c-di-GMP phosphodiesterase class II)
MWAKLQGMFMSHPESGSEKQPLTTSVQDTGLTLEKMLETYDATLESWSHALELRERETGGHGQRVVSLTIKLAQLMGVKEEDLPNIRRGALLHDIGKMAVPDSILLKPGPLTPEEWTVMRQHPDYSYQLLQPIKFLESAMEIPYCHHERWDGNGYPRGIKKEEIPLAARIFAVVDVWDALRSDRPYRPAWEEEKVREYIHSLAGSYFDPKVVEVFLKMMATEKV